MRILLDTHTLLWFTLGDSRLSAAALILISDPGNDKVISPASYWEIAIKVSLNKLALHQSYEDFIDQGIRGNGFGILSIEPWHTAALLTLPHHHRDPFDRLLIAQAIVERIPLLSGDAAFDSYPVRRLW